MATPPGHAAKGVNGAPTTTLDREVIVQIRLLGGFVVERGGQPVDARAWRLRKARTLVKLLALRPDQRLHRDFLLDALWPDRDPTSAVNNLHQAGRSRATARATDCSSCAVTSSCYKRTASSRSICDDSSS